MSLQGSLNTLNQAQADAQADLELQRTQATNNYNSAIASARAGGNYELASTLYQKKVRAQDAATASEQYQNSLALQKAGYDQGMAEYNRSLSDAEYSRRLQMAQIQAQYGDFSGYEALGIDTTQMKKTWQRQYG